MVSHRFRLSALALVAGLSIPYGAMAQTRGVTSSDLTEKGDPSAAFMADGIYIARAQAQEVSFFDVQRVEVLRGPQGRLFGRNTTAGRMEGRPLVDRQW